MRLRSPFIVAAVVLGTHVAHAEPPAAPAPAQAAAVAPSDADLERQALELERSEQAELQRKYAEGEATRRAEQDAAAKQDAALKLEKAERAARRARSEDAHDSVVARRTWGIVLSIAAVSAGAASIYFARDGEARNHAIRSGSLDSGTEISRAVDKGQTDNTLAIGCGVAAGVLAAVGVPLIVFNLHAPDVDIAASPVNGGGIASVSVHVY